MHRIPVKPMSVNQAWKGRRFKTPTYKAFEQEMLLRLPRLEIPSGDLQVAFEFGVSNPSFDYDNGIKQTQDVLQKKYGFNDSRIYRAVIDKVVVPKGQEHIKFAMEPHMSQSTFMVGQFDSDLTAYCHLCRANIRAYWVKKDGVPVVALCPKPDHNQPCTAQVKELPYE